ncbi:MAG: UDP-3-O-(3-hydroxymyristoyl)glucosamine N-acyltransferase [Marinilabiliales bacterium]|nr:MAG: UDP-3-O-(3-hydroxymyristoyl)glucosamine N-acyltransferase [Marinilabiliales bacterium]
MEFTAKQISELLNGKVEGDENVVVSSFSKIEEGKPGSLSFLANPKYTSYIYETSASVVLVNNDFVAQKEIGSTLIRVEDSYKAIAKLLEIYNSMAEKPSGIEKNSYINKKAKTGKNIYVGAFAYIGKGAQIGDNVKIYPGCYIGNNVTIGDNCVLFPGVKVYYNTIIGKGCTIHAGTIIGADGFGFAPNTEGAFVKIAQIGNVIIEDNVELGALVTIDRATMGSTIIRKGVKLDNQNHVAHNVEIGENTVIAAQSGIAGTAKLGKNCMIGGQVGISPHVKIADGTKISAQSGISNNIKKENSIVMGAPAYDIREYHKSYVHFKNLDKIVKRLDELEKKLKENN